MAPSLHSGWTPDLERMELATKAGGRCAGRLDLAEYAKRLGDAVPALTAAQALAEASRCLYCFDAPCITACPTGIDIPSFIARIAQGNTLGAATKIWDENILGGMCARVCPTEVLCEQACVRTTLENKPVEIGRLQRYATDAHLADDPSRLFVRAPATGKTIAVVGAGPAGLSCAHRLAWLGHEVVLLEAKPKLGGLNEYGLATYKTAGDFAQREIEWLLGIGGIRVQTNFQLGRDQNLDQLVQQYDAVFLGLGLAGVNPLGLHDQPVDGVLDAVEFIAQLRQASHPASVPVGRSVVVIGGGMTAIDAAVQSRLLGAEQVTLLYRRGPESMSATEAEQQWALSHGVVIRHWATPHQLVMQNGELVGVEFISHPPSANQAAGTSKTAHPATELNRFVVPADQVLKAVGQTFIPLPVAGNIAGTNSGTNSGTNGGVNANPTGAEVQLALQGGRIHASDTGETSHPKVWAGGDCVGGGQGLTVQAIEHGKRAALSIHQALTGTVADAPAHY